MRLTEWLEKKGLNDAYMAKAIGITAASFSGYRTQKTTPSLRNAIIINKLTNGDVGFEDMLRSPVPVEPEAKTNELDEL